MPSSFVVSRGVDEQKKEMRQVPTSQAALRRTGKFPAGDQSLRWLGWPFSRSSLARLYLALTGNPGWCERGTRLIGFGRCLLRALIRGVRGKDHTASCLHIHCSSCVSSQTQDTDTDTDTVVTAASHTSGGRAVSLGGCILAEPGYGTYAHTGVREARRTQGSERIHAAAETRPETRSLLLHHYIPLFRRLGNDTRRRRVQHRTTPLLLRLHRRAVACVPKPVQGSPTPPPPPP